MRRNLKAGGLALTLWAGLSSIGCQTYQLGQVLPTPYFLRDDIQYFPKGPDFPLANELNAMEEADREYRESQR
jgi:hypothetical protein